MPDTLAVASRRPAPRHDGLSPAQYRAVVVGIAVAHVAAIYGVLQVPAVRASVLEAAPIFVNLLAPPEPEAPPPPPPPPPVKAPIEAPKPTLITAAPSPAPAVFEAPPAPEQPAPPSPVVAEAPPAPPVAVAPPPPPKIPPSEIQYLNYQPPEYPRLSVRANETGTVLVFFYIDPQGLPQQISIKKSSGFPRLDEAGVASVRKSRFKPYTRDGVALTASAEIPIIFELENK